ncbi:MAG TPA: ABC transporter ATP-binding protein [Bellilinea sp.]|nr:ABC transporter ATP-binding protein [Bellilinea sp.]
MTNAAEVKNLTVRFGSFTAVDNTSFSIGKGEIFGLLGPNGAGKTTTIRVMCGISRPTSGDVMLAGYDVRREPEEVKKRIGYMSQRFSLYNDLTPAENLGFYASIYNVPSHLRADRIQELLKMADLLEHKRTLTRNLSGAWRQRLALACSIVHQPEMLFLDEPTAGVDPISRREFWDLIYQLASQDVSVLATTHYMDEADYCNTIGMMYEGRLVALDSPQGIKDKFDGTLVEIASDDPSRIVEAGDAFNGRVKHSVLHGALAHITVTDGTDPAGIIRELQDKGLQITSWDVIRPSLEDVFIGTVEDVRLQQAGKRK